MLLILTHEKADFDAVASQLAARKLYPEATPLLPHSLNRNVTQFLNLYWDALPFVRATDWKRRRVEEILLVDTQHLNNVRGVVKDPRVTVIDHHMGHTPKQGWTYQVEPVGATVTLLIELLQNSGLSISAEEATLLLLGIYEDTGSLTYDTATPRDARAAAWLLEQHAQLDVVRRFLSIPFTPLQQKLYDALQLNARWLDIHGRKLVITSAKAPQGFVDEISSVAHRLRETLMPDGLFVLVQLGSDVQMVARSSHESVDVATVAQALGGGGHERAAAALVVKANAADVASRLEGELPAAVQPAVNVSAIMSYGVQTIDPTLKVSEAAALMQRSGHEGYPVVDDKSGRIQGLLTRHAVDRAVSHELGHLPVSRIMRAGSFSVRPSDSIQTVQSIMLSEGWGQIPVVDETESADPVGIVTRTDLLNFWFRPPPEKGAGNLAGLLSERLSPSLWAFILAAGAVAADMHMPLYFVGGLVRDLLLGNSSMDIDLVVEGDAIELVRRLRERYGGEAHSHSRFGTAKWFMTPAVWKKVRDQKGEPGLGNIDDVEAPPSSVDFVTARTEFYSRPSALPDVERGSIKLDLHRRDFTINTLAVRLDGAHLGELLDFYGGVRDIDRGLIRVLHSLSFIDDPTRVLRAVRLEQRLEFTIESRTAELLADSLSMLDRVTGDRIRHEIEAALREVDPARVMRRLDELQVLSQIDRGLSWTQQAEDGFKVLAEIVASDLWQAGARPDEHEFLYFVCWLWPLPDTVKASTMRRLHVRKSTREDMQSVKQLAEALASLPSQPPASGVEKICRRYPLRVLLAGRAVLAGLPASGNLDDYMARYRHVRTVLNGDDLRAMGLPPGPMYARWLDALLAARLDGVVVNEAGERALLVELTGQSES